MTGDDARRRMLASLEFQARFDSRLRDIDAAEGFDVRFGVDTDTPVELWDIAGADGAALRYASRYSPTPVRTIRAVIRACPVAYEDVSFVDFGSGKGRVMLVASEFPFRAVHGVEFSAGLCETAEANLRRYRSDDQRCDAFRVHCQDAAEFTLPEDAGVCYFYEPFAPQVAERVMDNIERSLGEHPRKMVLCFVGRGWKPVDEKAGTVSSVVCDRPPWQECADMVTSPDEGFYDARLYTNEL
ncbi:class I SAM-dependent methyltransferase [Nocardiopsis sp. ARC36]